MAGQPAARVGDSVKGGKITSGSASVLIGDCGEGQADSPCKDAPAVGSPVNPMLGIKILPPEIDFALAAPEPFVFARRYASDDPRVGALGPGWSTPGQGLGLELHPDATVVIDEQGRRIAFGPLAPGQALFSVCEGLWVRRGGPHVPMSHAGQPWQGHWASVPQALQHDPCNVFVCAGSTLFHWRRLRAQRWRLLSQFNRHGYATVYCWNADGLLHEVRDSAARRYGFAYTRVRAPGPGDSGLRLLGVVLAAPGQAPDPQDAHARWLVHYGYDEHGRLARVSDRTGQVQRCFAWDARGRLISHGQPGAWQVHYEWDEGPDGRARVVAQHGSGPDEDAPGLSRRFVYHPQATEVHDSLGRQETYHFDGQGGQRRLVAHTRADGSVVRHELDWARRSVGHVDPLGRRFGRVLDGQSRVIGYFGPERAHVELTLEPLWGEVLCHADASGARWRIERDTQLRPVAVVDPQGHRTAYAYEDARLPDRPTAVTDAHGGVQRLRYTGLGQLCEHTDCTGQRRTWDYDDEGRLLRQGDALGRITACEYDAAGRLCAVVAPDGARTTLGYDAFGRLIRHTDALGRTTTYARDAHGRIVAYSAPGGQHLRARYDAAGRLVQLTNANGAHLHLAYDAMDHLVQQRGFDERTQHWRYNAAGELIEQHEHMGDHHGGQDLVRITRYERDGLGRLVGRHLPATDCAPALREHYRYDAAGRLCEAFNSVARVQFSADKAGRPLGEVLQVRDPQGDTIAAAQAGAAGLAAALAAAPQDGWQHVLALHRDALGALESTQIGCAPALQWLRYGPGHLHGLRVHAAGQPQALLALDIERDTLHREVARHGAGVRSERGYDGAGLLQHWRTILPGLPAWTRELHRDAAGRLTRIDDSQHGPSAYTYDAADRLVASRHGKRSQRYAYDAAGNRIDLVPGQVEAPPHASGAEHTHAGRAADGQAANHQSTADADAARCAVHDDRIACLQGFAMRYDPAGNLRSRVQPDGTRLDLGYDGAHRLVELIRTDAQGARTHARYAYDPLGRRVRKTVHTADGHTHTTHYGWDGDRLVTECGPEHTWTWVYEGDSAGAGRAQDDHGAQGDPGATFTPLACLRAPTQAEPAEIALLRRLCAQHHLELPAQAAALAALPHEAWLVCTDHLGTPLALLDAQGQPAWQAQPDDWAGVGHQDGHQNSQHSGRQGDHQNAHLRPTLRLPGQWFDEESGLHYNRHRYYDPHTGRYITQDPIGPAGGSNPYVYAQGNPVTACDPLGLFVVPQVYGAGALFAGLYVYSTVRGTVGGAVDVMRGGDVAGQGRRKDASVAECLGKQMTGGYGSCPRSGTSLQDQYNKARTEVQEGVQDMAHGAFEVGTSIPGMTSTGPVPTSTTDLIVNGVLSTTVPK